MGKKRADHLRKLLREQPTLARITLTNALKSAVRELKPGNILEIGAGDRFSHVENLRGNFRYYSLNILISEQPTIVGDACLMPLREGCLDGILMLEVLEHICTPGLALEECQRVLKPGGTIIGSTRFIHPQHGAPCDYYRFTEDALKMLLGTFSSARIIKLGNRVHVVLDIMFERFPLFRLLNRIIGSVRHTPSTCYSGLLFIARK